MYYDQDPISHLVTGSELAILNGPTLNTTTQNKEQRRFAQEFTLGMERALKHYQNGGTIFNRP